ncbi:MAG: PA2779 family protein [Thermodesulfobacteriota bacterium]
MIRPWMKCISWYLVVAMFIIGITPRVYAEFSPSEVIGFSPTDRASDLQKIQKVIEMKMIGERLRELGLTPDEIQNRLSLLSDQQIHQFALQLDELKIGGDGLGIIVGLLVIAILVVILLYLMGHRVIITK